MRELRGALRKKEKGVNAFLGEEGVLFVRNRLLTGAGIDGKKDADCTNDVVWKKTSKSTKNEEVFLHVGYLQQYDSAVY